MGSGASKNKASTTISQNAELPPDEGKVGHLDEVQTIQIQSESPEKGLSAANSKQSQEPKQQLNVVNQPTQQIGQGNQPNPQIGQQPGPPWQTEHSQRQRWQNDQRPNQQWWTGNQPDIQSWQTKPQPYQQWQPQQQPHQYLGAGGPPNSSWHAPQQPYHYWQREQPPNQQLQVGQQPYQSWQTERLPSSPWQAGLHATQWSEGRPSSHPWPAEHQPNQSWQQPSQQQNPHWQEMYQHHQSGRPEQIPNPQMQPRQQPFEHLGRAHQPPNPNWRAEPHSYHPWEREQPPNPNWQTENPLDPMWETGRQSPFCNSGQKPFELVHTGHPLNATTQIRKQPNHLQPNSKFEAERPMHPAQCQAVQPFQNIPYQPGNLQQPLQSAHDQFQAGKKASQPSQPSQISEENYPDRQNKECQPQRSRGESKETMSIPVEPDVMQFIYGSSYSEELAKLKYERGIKVTWEAGSELAEIVSEGHRSPQLQTESIKAVGSFIQKFVRVDIPVKKEIWAEVQKQLPKVRATLSDSLIKSFEPQLTLKIVSLRSNIDSCRNRLEAHLEKIYKEVTFQQEVISSSKEGFIILLKAMDVHEMLRQENCQEVEFELDQKNQEVHLAGPCDQIKIAKQVFNDLMGKAAERPIGLDCDVLTILAKEDAQKTVEKAFKEQNIEATMLVSGYRASKVLARSEKHAANAVFLISGMVKKGEVRYTAKHSSLIASKAWDDYCKSTEIKANVIINKDSTGTTCIFGLKDNVETAVRRLQFFLDNSSEREEEIKCFSADSREYLLRRRKADIENFGVKIREGDGTSTFYISGQEIPLKNAEDFLNGIIKDVTVSEVHFQQPGLVKFDESGKLDEQVKELEEKEKCFIRVEKHLISTSPPVQRGNQFLTRSHFRSALARNNHSLALSSLSSLVDSTIHVTKQGQRISWKLGDITKEKVDALVIPQGACFNKIRSDFDSTTCQAVDELKFGEIATSTGVSLPCSHVIHTCCAFWNGPSGNGEGTLRAIVHKSLNEAGQLGGNSIAFPIIGTGNLLFPIHDACRIMLEEAVKFCESYPYSVVKDIRFIVFDRDQSLIDAFKQEVVMIKKGSGCVKNPGAEKWLSVIEVANGDLTQETTDAIVNINSTSLNMNAAGELSKAVANASGPQVQQECNQLGSQAPGSAVITSGGNLNVRHIIHIVPGSSDKSHLQQCLEEGLQLADGNNLQSISVPTIGTGGYGLSASDSAEVTFQAVRNASASLTSISKVRIIVYQATMMSFFQQEKVRLHTQQISSTGPSLASMDVSSQTKKSAVRLWVTGKNKASVDAAINGLKKAFTEACTSKHIKNEAISSLSQRQINKLEQEAFKSDVEIKFDEVAKCVTVRGYIQKIPDIVNKIMEEINEGMRLEKQSQENEHANVVAKMVEWSYEKQGKNINFDPKTNAKLETANGKKELSVKVDILGKEFVIDLKGNIGYCSRDGEQIKVYRSTKEGVPLPKHWSPMPYGKEVHLEQLVPGSPEYQDVICKVQATVAGVNILKIERIQNPALYQAYIVKKEKLDKIVNGNTEKQLFHGTDGKNITKINTQGFNRSLAGKNGTAYGYGVYFARDALYSYRYALGNPGFRKMYLARVLVGRYCQGRPGMLTPPPLNVQRPELLFDSVVDNPAQPTIFVVFHDSSCFPEYLLTF